VSLSNLKQHFNLTKLQFPPVWVATHYKTNERQFPEKDRQRPCQAAESVRRYRANLRNYNRLQAGFPAKILMKVERNVAGKNR
jgi:hypothetical protein